MASILIRKQGSLIDVSLDGNALPKHVIDLLDGLLTYDHVYFKKGYNPISGKSDVITTQTKKLYCIDDCGRLCCQKGWLARISHVLRDAGFDVAVIDKDDRDKSIYEPDWSALANYPFRPMQRECLERIAASDGGIIDAVPAFGKSHLMAMIAGLYPRAKIAIVTKRRDVAYTLERLVKQFTPDVGRVGAGKRKQRQVTIYTADSLHHCDGSADFLLLDEVHELVTDRYCSLLARFMHSRNFGFTATVSTRFDNAHRRLEGLCGPVIFKLTYREAQDLGIVVPIVVQWIRVDSFPNPCGRYTDSTLRKRYGIWRHHKRNAIIASVARETMQTGYQTLILVETVEHALMLSRLLPEFELCYSENCLSSSRRARLVKQGFLDPDFVMTATRRNQLRKRFESREIMGAIATGVWSVGVSFDSLEVLIRADASASHTMAIQAPGRVCRISDGKAAGIVFDFMDYWDKSFLNRSYSRRRFYAHCGWTQLMPDGGVWTK